MDFVVDDFSVVQVRKSTDILVRDAGGDLFDDLFALTSHDHVDIRTTLKQVFDFLRCFVAANNGADLRRQLRHVITDSPELSPPSDADAQKIDLAADKLAEHLRILIGPFISKIKKCHLADQVFHACGDVLEAGRREHSHGWGGMAEIRVQS